MQQVMEPSMTFMILCQIANVWKAVIHTTLEGTLKVPIHSPSLLTSSAVRRVVSAKETLLVVGDSVYVSFELTVNNAKYVSDSYKAGTRPLIVNLRLTQRQFATRI